MGWFTFSSKTTDDFKVENYQDTIPAKGGITYYTNWLSRFVTRYIQHRSVALKDKTVNISSVARYICERFLNTDDETTWKKIKSKVQSLSSETKELAQLIAEVVGEYAKEKEVGEEPKKKSIADLVKDSLVIDTKNLDGAQELQSFITQIQSQQGVPHPDTSLIKKVEAQVTLLTQRESCKTKWTEIKNKFKEEMPTSLNGYLIPEKSTSEDYARIKENLDKLEKCCEMKQAIQQSYFENGKQSTEQALTNYTNAIIATLKGQKLEKSIDALQKTFETQIALFKEQEQQDLREKIKKLPSSANPDLSKMDLKALKEEYQARLKIKEAKERETELGKAIIKLKERYTDKADEQLVSAVVKDTNLPDEFIPASITLLKDKITKKETTKEDIVNYFPHLMGFLKKKQDSISTAMNDLINNKETFVDVLIEEFPKYTKEELLSELEDKFLGVIDRALQGPKGDKKTALETALLKGFQKNLLRLNALREKAWDLKEKFPLSIKTALRFDFSDIKETSPLTSGKARSAVVFNPICVSTAERYEKELFLEVSKLREAHHEKAVHPISVGFGVFEAKNAQELFELLNKFTGFSNKLRGVTLIPGRIKVKSPELEIAPVFEDGCLITVGGNQDTNKEEIKKRLATIFLMPNGTSMALAAGQDPAGFFNNAELFKKEESLPNKIGVDCLIALGTGSESNKKAIINKSGLYIQAGTKEKKSWFESTTRKENGLQTIPPQGVADTIDDRFVSSPPFNISKELNFSDLCTDEEKKKIAQELSRIKNLKKPESVQDIFDTIELSYSIADKEAFSEAIKNGKIPSTSPQQFLALLSKAKGKDHAIVVYTDSRSVPVLVFRDGICSPFPRGEDLIPGANKTIIGYSFKEKSFYKAEPNWEQFSKDEADAADLLKTNQPSQTLAQMYWKKVLYDQQMDREEKLSQAQDSLDALVELGDDQSQISKLRANKGRLSLTEGSTEAKDITAALENVKTLKDSLKISEEDQPLLQTALELLSKEVAAPVTGVWKYLPSFGGPPQPSWAASQKAEKDALIEKAKEFRESL